MLGTREERRGTSAGEREPNLAGRIVRGEIDMGEIESWSDSLFQNQNLKKKSRPIETLL